MRTLRAPKILDATYIDVTPKPRPPLTFGDRITWFARGIAVMAIFVYMIT